MSKRERGVEEGELGMVTLDTGEGKEYDEFE